MYEEVEDVEMLITETAEMEIDTEFYSLFCDEVNSLVRNPSVDRLRIFLAVRTKYFPLLIF